MCSQSEQSERPAELVDHGPGEGLLGLCVILRFHVLPGVGTRQGGQREDRRPRGRAAGVRLVQADRRLHPRRFEGVEVFVGLLGIHVRADEVAVALDAQRLGRAVEPQVDDEGARPGLPGVGQLEGPFGNRRRRIDQAAVDQARRGVGEDEARPDPLARGGFDARHAALFREDLRDLDAVFGLPAQRPDPGVHGGGHPVGALLRDMGPPEEVVVQDQRPDREGEAVHREPDVAPVGVDQVEGGLGEAEGPRDLIHRVARRREKGGVLFRQDLAVGLSLHPSHVGDPVEDPLADLQVSFQRLAAPRDGLRDGFDEVFNPERDLEVHPFLREDQVVGLGDGDEFEIRLPLADEELPDESRLLGRTDVGELVERGLELEAAADEARGEAAGEVVLFEQQHADPFLGELQGGGQPPVSRPDDDAVVRGVEMGTALRGGAREREADLQVGEGIGRTGVDEAEVAGPPRGGRRPRA